MRRILMDPWRGIARGLAAAALLGALCAGALHAGTDRSFEWSGVVAPGRTVEIKTVNGAIHAEAARGDRVEITAVKRWNRSDPDEVTIEVIEHEGGVTICTKYPGRGNRCGVGDDGRMSVNRNDVSVEYEVRLPRGVAFAGRTVNGRIEATDLTAPAHARTVNGSIEIATGGRADAETVNGSIRVAMGASHWDDALSFRTVNGRIDLVLPADTGAEVSARTVNGSIHTDLPLTVKGRFGPRSLHGRIGAGGGGLTLETVNGGIRLQTGS